jgi:T5SS/PEP-CTERM-associated repeat protein
VTISNSELNINGTSGGILDVTAGSLTLESGTVDCTTTTASKVGDANSGTGTLTINGGTMRVFQILVGALTGSQGILNLSNGLFDASSLISVGDKLNSTGEVTIAGGQLWVTNDITKIGNAGVGQLTLHNGSGNFAFLSAGDGFGARGTIQVNGGLLRVLPRTTNDFLRLGNFGTGTLDIRGGTNLVLSELHLADNLGSTGIVTISGGALIATNDITSIGRFGEGTMTVSNAVVQLTNSSVGRHDGAVGHLTIQSGGLLSQVDDLSIGRFSNSVGHVFVNGGSLSLPNDNIWVGREGTGDLTVSNGVLQAKAIFVGMSPDPTNVPVGTVLLAGGTTLVSSNVVLGSPSLSTGQVFVAGGALVVTNGPGSAILNVRSGAFTLLAGSVTADTFLLTNSSAAMTVSQGTLRVKNTVVDNGLPFVLGDGVNPATLELLGGTHTFVNGLVISSNATVSGCGTIVGPISNFGTIATNCAPPPPLIVLTVKTGNTATVFFTTVAGSNHVLEYKDSLSATGWNAILPGVIGNGNVMSASDPAAFGPSRFYRIHRE